MFVSKLIFILLILYSTTINVSLATDVNTLKKQLLNTAEESEAQIAYLIKLAEHYLYLAPKESANYAQRALLLTEKYQDDSNRAKSLRLLGQSQLYQGLNQEAYLHLERSVAVAKVVNDPHILSVNNRALGVFYELILNHDNAMTHYIEAMRYAKKSSHPKDLAMAYNNLGNLFMTQRDYLNAEKYFEQSISINQTIGDIEMEMNALVGLGAVYLKSGKLIAAEQQLNYVINAQEHISDFTYSEALVNLAHIARLQKKYDEAIAQYYFILSDKKASSYLLAVAAAYAGLGEALTQIGKTDQAIDTYQAGIVNIKGKTSVESEMALYENLAKLQLNLGNFEAAAKAQADYIKRRNEIQPLQQVNLISKLKSQLETERNNIKLQEKLLRSEQASKLSSFYLFAVIVISLIATVLVLALLLRRQTIEKLETKNKVLKQASETDPLTRIGNRRYLDGQLKQLRTKDVELAFLLLDIDNFKQINDRFGHDAGDKTLISVAETITDLCRKEDLFARIGGEEFVIIITDMSPESAIKFADRVRASIESLPHASKQQVTTSIGLSFSHIKDAKYDQMYKQADMALYKAKHSGKNTVVIYE